MTEVRQPGQSDSPSRLREDRVVYLLPQESDFDVGASLDPREILQELRQTQKNLVVLPGRPLPDGWLGKPWACQQLFEACQGELLLFVDADTRHQPGMLKKAVAALQTERADLLTAMVHLQVGSIGEGLLVPFMYWSVLTFFPIWLASHFNLVSLSVSVGQFMLFRREAYERIGGHAAIRGEIVDDFQIGRRIIQGGMRHRFMDAIDLVDCRMYAGLKEAINGFRKNFYPAFRYQPLLFFFVFTYLLVLYLEPLLLLLFAYIGWLKVPLPIVPVVASILLAIGQHAFCHQRLKIPVYYSLLYPARMALAFATAVLSFISHARNRATWKERRVT